MVSGSNYDRGYRYAPGPTAHSPSRRYSDPSDTDRGSQDYIPEGSQSPHSSEEHTPTYDIIHPDHHSSYQAEEDEKEEGATGDNTPGDASPAPTPARKSITVSDKPLSSAWTTALAATGAASSMSAAAKRRTNARKPQPQPQPSPHQGSLLPHAQKPHTKTLHQRCWVEISFFPEAGSFWNIVQRLEHDCS